MKYLDLLEDCKNIYIELSYNSRWVRIAMFHLIGKTLIENEELITGKIDKFANALGVSAFDLGTAILFAYKYPILDDFQHDKTISWSQVRGILDEESKEA